MTSTIDRVDVVDDPRELATLGPRWNELLQASDADCPFLTWEWLYAWWTHLRGGAQLRLLTARAGTTLVAIAPMVVAPGRFGLFSRLQFLGTGSAGSDYLDLIVRRGWEEESVRAMAASLRHHGLALQLTHLSPASTSSMLRAHLVPAGWTSRTSEIAVCPFIRLDGHTWDTYLATLGAAHRANVRRRTKALSRQFRVHFGAAGTEAERREALDALVAFHARRWTGKGGSSAFQSAELRAFHDDVTRRTLDAGWLRLYVLRVDDAPAAVMYGFAYNRRFYFYQHGFDPQYQSQSIGLVMMGRAIRAAIEDERAGEFDMLYGNEGYKSLWAREQRSLHQIELFPADLRGTLHQALVEAERTARGLVRRFRSGGEPHAA